MIKKWWNKLMRKPSMDDAATDKAIKEAHEKLASSSRAVEEKAKQSIQESQKMADVINQLVRAREIVQDAEDALSLMTRKKDP